jgi:hypothetical protein
MELFANVLRFDYNNKPVPYYGSESDETSQKYSIPDSNFDNFFDALLTVFIVFANDGWTTIYFNYYRTVGAAKSTLFFITLVVLG